MIVASFLTEALKPLTIGDTQRYGISPYRFTRLVGHLWQIGFLNNIGQG